MFEYQKRYLHFVVNGHTKDSVFFLRRMWRRYNLRNVSHKVWMDHKSDLSPIYAVEELNPFWGFNRVEPQYQQHKYMYKI